MFYFKIHPNPGMPTFPIVGRKHVEIFGGFCPPHFINQDADPWVYAVYRRFGYASFIDVMIENEIGGAIETGVDARYERVRVENWRDVHIEPAVDKIGEYIGLVNSLRPDCRHSGTECAIILDTQ